MFGLLYLTPENEAKLKQVSEWQQRFLDRCKKIDKDISKNHVSIKK